MVKPVIMQVRKEPWRTAMPLKATSVRLDDDTLKRVGQMADAMDRPRAWLMAEAIKQYVEREEWFIREVEKGAKAADAGLYRQRKQPQCRHRRGTESGRHGLSHFAGTPRRGPTRSTQRHT